MFLTLKHRPDLLSVPSSVGAISKFFPGVRLLVLTYHDLDRVSRSSWFDLYDTITNFVQHNDIELIVIDRTGEPKTLDEIEHHGPNDISIKNSLKAIRPTVIVTDDYSYYSGKDPDVICFPYNIWLLASRSVHIYENFYGNGYDTGLTKIRAVMCLNRKLHWHRILLYLQLKKRSWFDQLEYSFVLGNDRMDEDFLLRDLYQEEIDDIRTDARLPITLAEEQVSANSNIVANGSVHHWTSVSLPVYNRNAMNLVTETSLNHGVLLTEKAVKPIMAYQIPVILAASGANAWLQSLGFDLFADFVPWHTWDELLHQRQKIMNIVQWLDAVMEDAEQIVSYHRRSHDRLRANKQLFHSAEFVRQLEQPIRAYARSISSTSA